MLVGCVGEQPGTFDADDPVAEVLQLAGGPPFAAPDVDNQTGIGRQEGSELRPGVPPEPVVTAPRPPDPLG